MKDQRKGLILTIATALYTGFFTTGQLFGQSRQILLNVEAMDNCVVKNYDSFGFYLTGKVSQQPWICLAKIKKATI